jgi:thiol-disulfide isomerase/thioredoxin
MAKLLKTGLSGIALLVAISMSGCDRGPNKEFIESLEIDDPTDKIDSPAEIESFKFDLASVEGGRVTDADFENKVVMVDIWGTWCPPCREEIPHLVELQEKYGDQGFQIVGINYEGGDDDEAKAAIAEFTNEVPINYPLLLGTEAVQNQVPDFGGFPTKVLINREGKVVDVILGGRSKSELEEMIAPLL